MTQRLLINDHHRPVSEAAAEDASQHELAIVLNHKALACDEGGRALAIAVDELWRAKARGRRMRPLQLLRGRRQLRLIYWRCDAVLSSRLLLQACLRHFYF